jgi:HAD superfamily hydrolase (TIGR01549 family)
VAAYQNINGELWAAFRRGEITQSALAGERFRRLLAVIGGDPRCAAALGERYLDELSARGDRLPGCRAVLQQLQRRYRLGVVTNGIDRVQRARLAASGLAPLFDVIVTSQSCGYAKPDPRILNVALEAIGTAPRDALYVGDDPATDGVAARAAGVRFVWACGASSATRGPRRRVSTLRELPSLLQPTPGSYN